MAVRYKDRYWQDEGGRGRQAEICIRQVVSYAFIPVSAWQADVSVLCSITLK